jgi:hypothetical protein
MNTRINQLIVLAIETENARNRGLCRWLLRHPNSALADLIDEGLI